MDDRDYVTYRGYRISKEALVSAKYVQGLLDHIDQKFARADREQVFETAINKIVDEQDGDPHV